MLPRCGSVECIIHFLVCLVFGFVFCGGKNLVEGKILSETIKAVGMRGSGKEGKG
jgi:hypothetical protein